MRIAASEENFQRFCLDLIPVNNGNNVVVKSYFDDS